MNGTWAICRMNARSMPRSSAGAVVGGGTWGAERAFDMYELLDGRAGECRTKVRGYHDTRGKPGPQRFEDPAYPFLIVVAGPPPRGGRKTALSSSYRCCCRPT